MADYLLPTNNKLTISEKQKMFAVKNRMINIPANFPKPKMEYKCYCGEKEDMKHIYNCEINNDGKQPSLEYEKIYTGKLTEQIDVFRKFENNCERRERLKIEDKLPCDPLVIHCSQQSIVMD